MEEKVTALVPVLNEAKTIGRVLEALAASRQFDCIIVIDGGSRDGTQAIAKSYPVMFLQGSGKKGKGGDVREALGHVHSPITLLCDGDLVGLRPEHIPLLLEPVQKNAKVMSVALLDKMWHFGSEKIKEHITLMPINGTRALYTTYLRGASAHPLFADYGIEPVINFHCRKEGIAIKRINLHGVHDIMKPQKENYGWKLHGKEIVNVTEVYARLYASDLRKLIRR